MSTPTDWAPPPLITDQNTVTGQEDPSNDALVAEEEYLEGIGAVADEWTPPAAETPEAPRTLADLGIDGELLAHNPKYEVLLSELYDYANIANACRVAGVKRQTFYNWRAKDAEFDAACVVAYQAGMQALEDEAMRRAHKGVLEPVFYNGVECGVKRKFSDGLTQFLLEGNMPEKYRKRLDAKIEQTGPLNTLVIPATMDMQDWLNKHGQ